MFGGNLDAVGLMGKLRQELNVISFLVLLRSVIGLWIVGWSCNRQLYHCKVNGVLASTGIRTSLMGRVLAFLGVVG